MSRPDAYPREDPPPARCDAADATAFRPLFVPASAGPMRALYDLRPAPLRDRATYVFVSSYGDRAAEVDTLVLPREEWASAPESRDSSWLARFVGGHVVALRLSI